MSKNQTLRALVTERLAAAAEDIFVLFERWTAEYEEQLCRYKEENQRKQQLLDKVLSPRIELVRGNYQIPSTSPGLDQEIPERPGTKEEPEEQSVKQEEEQLPVSVPESSAVCVKTEDSSLLQQRQTEHREETQGEDISSEQHFHSETETEETEHSSDTDSDDHWEPFSCTAEQMEIEDDGDHYNQIQSRDRSIELSLSETTVHNEDMSGADGKKHQCYFCSKRFMAKRLLMRHVKVHTGEKPYNCTFCEKMFFFKHNLERHEKTHTGEKPYRCSVCDQTFADKYFLEVHSRIHAGEKPYSCTVCGRTFTQTYQLTHTAEKPYSCTVCKRIFRYPNLYKKLTS